MDDIAEILEREGALQTDTLSITLSGPFVYVFNPGHVKTTVDIYAPFCPYHEAGIFFSRGSVSETELWKCAQSRMPGLCDADRIYTVYGEGMRRNTEMPKVVPPSRNAKEYVGIQIIGVTDGTSIALRLDKMMFNISLPRPKYVFPLYFDKVEVVPDFDTAPTNSFSEYCTGLRFFYDWDSRTPIVLTIPTGEPVDITPPVFSDLPKLADIEIRYSGLDIADANDMHSDARSCFASLSTLAGLKHWLNYGDGRGCPTNPGHSSNPGGAISDPCSVIGHYPDFHTGADCHAPIIVAGLS